MLLKRLALRNYRVYEDFLDLELPSGLVGIYGSNGSGKSTLLESILFALWGKARTAKEDVRTAGVGGDCVAELTFEHEGHLYVVRRSLSGINLTAKAEVQCDGLAMAEGVRDAGRYLQQVLGMDDGAFRASVFAEQKQLAAFSDRSPAQRRDLVLQLLGITPLDAARDAARRDAREARASHDHLRKLLPDLEDLAIRADDAASAADAAKIEAEAEAVAATAAQAAAMAAGEVFARLDRLRQAYDGLVIEGRAAREQLDSESRTLQRLRAEQEELSRAAATLEALLPEAGMLDETQRRRDLLAALVRAEDDLAAVAVPPEPAAPDPALALLVEEALTQAQAEAAGTSGQVAALTLELKRAREQAARSAELTGGAACPMCGQQLGDAFETVREHRAAEVHDAEDRLAVAVAAQDRAATALSSAKADAAKYRAETDRALKARTVWERAAGRRAAAEDTLARARDSVDGAELTAWTNALLDPPAGLVPVGPSDNVPVRPLLAALHADLERRRSAAAEAARLQGRLERRTKLDEQIEQSEQRLSGAEHRVEVLREKVRELAFDAKALQTAEAAAVATSETAQEALRRATAAQIESTRAAARAETAAQVLAEGQKQHATLATLADESRHLGRLSDLLNAFRNTVVATVGPRLAVQAAELFAELTDNEYDYLKVDPDTYELQICDGGRLFGLDRFSGSEVDLANLALRVAISEHVRFQSGGTVGLLVLDEVFGPLDQDRKARMLQALERLRGRFRQVLVVTHDSEIKEQLPSAIEVVKQPGRRATARLVAV